MLPSYHKGGTVKEIDLQGLINEWTVLGIGGHIPFPCVKMGAEFPCVKMGTFQPASLTHVLASCFSDMCVAVSSSSPGGRCCADPLPHPFAWAFFSLWRVQW